jgi:acid phosphatase
MLIFLSCIYFAQAALLSVIETCRHGARAPIDFSQWDKGYWNEGMGELTQEGMRQQFLNGAEFRSRYVNSTSNIPGTYNASELYVRSTDVNRTIMSAESQMMGLFPIGPNIASNMQYKAVPPFGSVNFNTTIPKRISASSNPCSCSSIRQHALRLLTNFLS